MAPSSGPFFQELLFEMLHPEIGQHDFFRRWFVAPLLPIGLRPSVSRLSPGIAVGHVTTGRAPPTKIGLVRQVIGIVAGVSLSERRVPRRGIIALRHRARGKCSGQSSSQKKLFHNRLRDFGFAQELGTRGWKFAFLSPSVRRGGFLSTYLHLRCVPEASRALGLSVADDHELGKAMLRTAKP